MKKFIVKEPISKPLEKYPSISILGNPFKNSGCSNNSFLVPIWTEFKNAFLIFLLIISSIIFSGCAVIALPVYYPGDNPIPEEKYSFVTPGSTTKVLVNEKLGEPSAVRLGGKFFIYAGGQKTWRWVGAAGTVFGGGGGFSIPTYSTHLLIMEFDKSDVVSAVEKFSGDTGKLKNGMFVVNSGGDSFAASGRSYYVFRELKLIIYAPDNIDQKAKHLSVPPKKAVIYFYKKVPDGFLKDDFDGRVNLDGNHSVDPGKDGFLVWVVDPGNHIITPLLKPNPENPKSLTLNCNLEERYYVENANGILRELNRSVAEKEILQKRLVIDTLDMFDSN